MIQIYVVIFIFRPIDKLESYKRREISSTTHDPFHLIANLLIKGVVVGMIGGRSNNSQRKNNTSFPEDVCKGFSGYVSKSHIETKQTVTKTVFQT